MAVPLLAPIISSAFGWLLREIVVKFVVFTAVILLVKFLVPIQISYLSSFISSSTFTSFFNAIPPGAWYFLDFFRLDYGLPLIISAYVSRFLIRRFPMIG
jgi:hypothetical protein